MQAIGLTRPGFGRIGAPVGLSLVPGAVAYWDMTQVVGQVLPDLSGNGNHATLGSDPNGVDTNDPTPTAQGIVFDGIDNYLLLPGLNAAIAGKAGLTVIAVAKAESMGNIYPAIIGQTATSGRTAYMITKNKSIHGGGYDSVSFSVHNGAAVCVAYAPTILGETYECLIGRFVGGEAIEIKRSTSPAWSRTTTGIPVVVEPSPADIACIGRYTTSYLKGGVAFAAVYPFALTDAQIAQCVSSIRATLAPRGIAIPFEIGETYPTVLIQFDDALASVYTTAYPILRAAGMKATVYVTSALIGTPGYMTEAQLAELYAAGWDLGNHSTNHVHLANLSEAAQETEIATCTAQLDAWGFTRASAHLAYPFGDYNADSITAATARGILTARTISGTPMYLSAITPLALTGTVEMRSTDTAPAHVYAAMAPVIAPATTDRVVIVYGHRVEASAEVFNWSPAYFSEIVAWMQERRIVPLTITEFYRRYHG